MYSGRIPYGVGFHSDIFGSKLFASSPSFSQAYTSFFAYHRQGIHQMHLFA